MYFEFRYISFLVETPHDNNLQEKNQYDLKHSSALFLLKAKECLKISQTALDFLVNDITCIAHDQIKTVEVKSQRAGKGLLSDITNGIDKIFHCSKESPFKGLHSQYFRDNLGLVVSTLSNIHECY